MKHLKTFESFSVNEEFLGIDKIQAAVKQVMDELKGNPEFEKQLQILKSEFNKLDPETKAKLREFATESPKEVEQDLTTKSEIEKEASVTNEGLFDSLNWRKIGQSFFKGLGITTVSIGFVMAAAAIIKMTMTGSGYSQVMGIEAGKLAGHGMVTMLCAIVPLIISTLIEPETQA